jgi:TRAP-type transport system periplasmic protein
LSDPIRIVMGGFGPPQTSHSRGLKVIGDRLMQEFGNAVDVKYVWNVMDLGYQGGDLLWMTEQGILTLSYQSTSYLTERVPDLEFADLPFLFRDEAHARTAMDGTLGANLARRIEKGYDFDVVGYFENGYRHLSNRLRPVRAPSDLAGMRIRLMPSRMHARTFELLGAVPFPCDLKDGIEAIKSGTVDAQENPMANTVTYGAHNFHRYHTLTRHCYMSRGLYLNRTARNGWPEALQRAFQSAVREGIEAQRKFAVTEEDTARQTIEAAGGEIIDLSVDERDAFARAVRPLHDEARRRFGSELFDLL